LSVESKTVGVGSREPQLPVLRFGLKHLFWCVTGACLLLAALMVSSRADSMTPAALLLAVLAVALHVGGTAIGTRLREHANERRVWEAARVPGEAFDDGPPAVLPGELAVSTGPRSPLHGRELPICRLRACVVTGAILGGTIGLVALAIAMGERTTAAGIVVGGVSTAVVGAWLAFVAVNSWTIFRAGWRDAVNAGAPDEGRD